VLYIFGKNLRKEAQGCRKKKDIQYQVEKYYSKSNQGIKVIPS